MTEDPKMVRAVARTTCRATGRCKYVGRCNTSRCSVSLTEAESIIAAVRAHDAEQGMVTVPREATDEMVEAGVYELDVVSRDAGCCWGVMIAAAPTTQSGGKG